MTKSYIYSDLNEFNTKVRTLFDCVLLVGIGEKKPQTDIDEISFGEDSVGKSSPIILWKYPKESQNINQAIPEFCFPDLESRNEFKKNE